MSWTPKLPMHYGLVVFVWGVAAGLALAWGLVWGTWRVWVASDHAAHRQLQTQVDSVNARLEACQRDGCIFLTPRDTIRRPIRRRP